MTDCHCHPGIAASAACATCGQPCCSGCLVTLGARRYCAACKYAAIAPGSVPPAASSRDAARALQLAVFGVFCAGFLMGPIALVKALRARRRIRQDPSLGGEGLVHAALLVGLSAFTLWVWAIAAVARGIAS